MTEPSDRKFDLVLWGASGFTGRLVAEVLADHPDAEDLDWALGGRSRERLAETRDRLGPRFDDLPLVVGDSLDRNRLDEIAADTDVVCTTVGPYAKLGGPLVAACAEAGTDYCDLTGEVHWIRRMIDEHHRTARTNGARIVHCCGFDSIPSDLGTWLVQSEARDRWGGPCREVRALVWRLKGGISGGTAASLAGVMARAADDPETRRILADPYALNPDGERSGPDGPIQQGPAFEEGLEIWTAPFVMAAVNEKIVRRTNALRDYPWGTEFQYSEASKTGEGLGGLTKASVMSAGIGAFTAGMALGPTRRLLERFVLPESGEGPDREAIDEGYFQLRVFGRRPDGVDREFPIIVEVAGDADPGYGSTARMLAESALCLALDDEVDGLDGGVLTPAAAFGSTLVERLDRAGISFSVLQ